MNKELYIETQTNYERCIPRCVVKLNNKGETVIPIVNLTHKDTLKKEEKLTKGKLCKEKDVNEVVEVKHYSDETNPKIKLDMVNVNSNMPEEVKLDLYKMLQHYEDCFAINIREFGLTNQIVCEITVTDQPVIYRPYRLSRSEREKVRDMVNELKSAGIVISPYASTILIVHKKTGDERLCIDYRGLNKITKKITYPLLLTDDQIDRLSGKKYFITLDMRSGYYQIPVSKDSQHKTAFITPYGMFEFLRMPFSIVNGPAIFQELINSVLGSLRFTIAMAYMDDIPLPSVTAEGGLQNL
ncbi:hypothetical protein Trydic_g1760 [Trypoxylus dichotomus]